MLEDVAAVVVPLAILGFAAYFGVTAEREKPHRGLGRIGYASAMAGGWLLALLVLVVVVAGFIGILFALGHGTPAG